MPPTGSPCSAPSSSPSWPAPARWSAATDLRDTAIVRFLADTGCRRSEIAGLTRDSVDLGKQEAMVLGKGGKRRIVPLRTSTERPFVVTTD